MGKSFRDYYNESPKGKVNKRNAFARPTKMHRNKSKYLRDKSNRIEFNED